MVNTLIVMGSRIRQLRNQGKISQLDLAISAGLQPSAVSDYEQGKRSPSVEKLEAIATALGVTTDYLLGRTDADSAKVQEPLLPALQEFIDNQDKHLLEPLTPFEIEMLSSIPGNLPLFSYAHIVNTIRNEIQHREPK